MQLFIVESPGKVKKIQGFLGPDFKVIASVGHVRDLPDRDMGVAAPDFAPHYIATGRGKEHLKKIDAAAKNAETIFLATDPDREGEAIAWHIADALKLSKTKIKRVTYTEITSSAILAAIKNARQINQDLVNAYAARRVLDRLVGYGVSPVLKIVSGINLSAGRVQSPAVRLVVEREQAIEAHKTVEHYGVELSFSVLENASTGWTAIWLPKHGWLKEGEEYILDKAVAEQVAKLQTLTVLDCVESTSRSAPPAPFFTSTLQQAASNALKLSPKKTMELAQKLYEEGHITYMRTDSKNLSDEAIEAIRSWAAEHDLPCPPAPRKWKSKADAQEAHEAIRPTHIENETVGIELENPADVEKAQALYAMIRLRAIASQLEDAVYDVRVVTLEGDVDGRAARFEARGRVLKTPGWTALVDGDQADESVESEPANPVPQQEKGRTATVRQARVVKKKTKPPGRFTEAALIRELEKRGIGRPSTYASTLQKIIDNEYVQVNKNRQLIPNESGRQIAALLTGRFAFFDYEFTREMETGLDDITIGKSTYLALVSAAHNRLEQEKEAFVAAKSPKCPDCGKALRHLVKADTREKRGYNFWSCTGYPNCPAKFSDDDDKPGKRIDNRPTPAPSDFKCPDCGKPLVRRTGIGKKGDYDFFGCTGFKTGCKSTFNVQEDGTPEFLKKKKTDLVSP